MRDHFDHPIQYGFGTTVSLPFAEALQRTREALLAEGFGVLMQIDLDAALRQRLGVDIRSYTILGACHAALAHRALAHDRDVGLLLPCNVAVYAADEPGHCVVAAIDPTTMLGLTHDLAIEPIAVHVRALLRRALERVAAAAGPRRLEAPIEIAEEIC